jgi:hypothetical protein
MNYLNLIWEIPLLAFVLYMLMLFCFVAIRHSYYENGPVQTVIIVAISVFGLLQLCLQLIQIP